MKFEPATLVKIAFGLTVAWVAAITMCLWFFNRYPRDDLASYGLNSDDTHLADFTRFFSSIQDAGFRYVDFLSSVNWPIYLTIFLATLGATGGVLQIVGNLRRGEVEDFSSQKRRNVATLAVAVSACVILGTFTILKATRKRYILSLFYALEVHLARFEGLVFNSIAIVGRKELLDTLLVYLIGYFERMEMHLINIQKVFLFEESEEFSNSMHEIGESVRAFKDDGFVLTETTDMILGDIEVEKRLLKVLRSLEYLQEIVRRYTRQLER